MEKQLIEYVRKSGRKPKRGDDGSIIVKGNGAGRAKKGVLVCGLLPDLPERVSIGFSLCSPMDEFDVVNGSKEPGFGLGVAVDRADKWYNFSGFFIQNTWTEAELEGEELLQLYKNPNPKEILEIPPSIAKQLQGFIARCRRYFKDKEFPAWVEKFENGEPEDCELVSIFEYEDEYFEIGD